MKKLAIIGLALILTATMVSSCAGTATPSATEPEDKPPGEEGGPAVGLANPSAVYCTKLGYKYEDGNCIFPDGTKCNAWDFFRGKCGQKYTYCEQQGYRIETRTENMGTWTAEYAVCVFDDGSECLEQDYFEGKCSSGECTKWSQLKGCECP